MGNLGQGIDDGPPGWRIWRAALAGASSSGGWESLIYTDAHLTGAVTDGLGSFQLFGTVAEPLTDALAPRLVLRVHWRDPGHAPKRSNTRIKKEGNRWLALNVDAEIACLLSLVTGCRMRSGGKVRTFTADDPEGRPSYAEHTVPAALIPAYRNPMMPGLAGVRLPLWPAVKPLAGYPSLDPHDAVTLVRAARHYNSALWVADSDPEQAWLQLVSALEAAATRWRGATADPVAVFKEHFPEPAGLIQNSACGSDLLASVARHFEKLIGAGRRVEDFVEAFKPPAPYPRPPTGTAESRVDWGNLRPVTKTIYKHRSALLHSGTPFPADLCAPPLMIDGIPEERPIGVSSTAGNTTWLVSDMPIRIHTFAYLTRGTILNWWDRMVA